MKINRKLLLLAVDTVRHVAAKRTTLPICNHLRIEAVANRLTLQATDCNQWIELAVDCDGDLNPICVHPTLLTNLICDGDEVTLEIADKKLNVTSSAVASLSFLDAAEFPPFPKEKVEAVGVNTADVAKGLKSVAWAVAEPKDGKPVGENVHIVCTANSLTAEATNGRVLAHWTMAAICAELDLVIHSNYVSELASFLADEDASLFVSDKYVSVTSKNGRYLASRSTDKYFKTKAILDDRGSSVGKVAIPALSDFCTRSLSLYGMDARLSPAVKLEFSKTGLKLSMASDIAALSASIKGKFKESKIKVGADYVKAACQAFERNEVSVELKDDLSPMILSAGNLTVVVIGMRWE